MMDIFNLALPYFGLILIGFACGKRVRLPEAGLAWMNFFLLYVALPALFFRIMARTPLEQLNNPPFILATTAATACAFALGFAAYFLGGGRERQQAVIAGLAGGYGNIGYMGPGLALAAIGAPAAVPVALIFCFDNVFLFTITPLLIALLGRERRALLPTLIHLVREIVFHPLIFASILGTAAAALHLHIPIGIDRILEFLQNAAAPVALFALGVTVALRPFETMPWELPGILAVKLIAHPVIAIALLMLLGPFAPEWIATALLMASLPPALSVFVMARQYDAWVAPASTAVLVGTLISVVTLPLVIWLIRSGALAQGFFGF